MSNFKGSDYQSNGRHPYDLVSYQIFFEIKNWHIRLDRLCELNRDILVDLNGFDLKNAHSIVVVIIHFDQLICYRSNYAMIIRLKFIIYL